MDSLIDPLEVANGGCQHGYFDWCPHGCYDEGFTRTKRGVFVRTRGNVNWEQLARHVWNEVKWRNTFGAHDPMLPTEDGDGCVHH